MQGSGLKGQQNSATGLELRTRQAGVDWACTSHTLTSYRHRSTCVGCKENTVKTGQAAGTPGQSVGAPGHSSPP